MSKKRRIINFISLSFILLFLFITLLQFNYGRAFAEEPIEVKDIEIRLDDNFLVVRGDWETADEGNEVSQTDDITSGTSYDRMIAYIDPFKNVIIEFDMLYVSASSTEAWCGVAFNKAKHSDTMNLSGYLLALKDYGAVHLYNWNRTQLLSEYNLPGEDHMNKGETHTWHKYKIVCVGENISVYIDGDKKIEVNDSTFSQGYLSINSGDTLCSFKNVRIGGIPVNMTIHTQISDGDLTPEEVAERNEHFEETKNVGQEEDLSVLNEGATGKIQHNYLEDAYVTIGNKTPDSYGQLFVIGIIAASLFVGIAGILVIKMILAGKKK